MQQRIAVIGLGRFGARLAMELHELGAEVIALDDRQERVDAVRDAVGQAIVVDVTDETTFQSIGWEGVDAAVVAIGTVMEASIIVVAQLVRLTVPHILARASTALHDQILRVIGAHDVIRVEESVGEAVARRLLAPGLKDRQFLPTGHEYVELLAPPSFWNQTMGALDLTSRFRVFPIAIRRQQPAIDNEGRNVYRSELLMEPSDEDVVKEGDRLALIGTEARLRVMSRAVERG